MARIKQLRSPIGRLGNNVGYLKQDRDAVRRDSKPWRSWYGTARWKKLRWSVLVRDSFTCRRCERIGADTSQLVADHRIPHRGDPALFWDGNNLQCLCKPCHDSDKQREERGQSV